MTWSTESAQSALARAIQLRDAAKNEAVLRGEFQSWLRRIFPGAADQAWVNNYSEGAEAHTRLQLPQGQVANRFIDTLVRRTAIEYEADLRGPRFDHGLEQVREYVAGAVRSGTPVSQVRGLLSDTVDWYVYDASLRDGVDPAACTAADIELRLIDEFKAAAADRAEGERFATLLRRHLAREQSRSLTASNIASDLGLESIFFRDQAAQLTGLVNDGRNADSSVGLATELWSRFVDGLERDGDEFRTSSYVDELYIALLARLLAASVLEGRALVSNDADLGRILTGEYFATKYRLQNVVEDDYFGWLTRGAYLPQVLPIARAMQRDLAAYDFGVLTEHDVFGRLMSQLARRSHRKLLGQEFTPSWLADQLAVRVLDRLPAGEEPQLVDMCCGSGSILAAILREVVRRHNGITVDRLMRMATGFDVDPLAVILAKTTWVVTLAGQLQGANADIVIPIYHADSLFASTPVSNRMPAPGDAGDFEIDLDGRRLVLPRELIAPNARQLFDSVVDWAYDEARLSVADGQNRVDGARAAELVDAIAARSALALDRDVRNRIIEAARALASQMSELALNNRNGIWAFVLRNTYRPGLLAGHFNGLVSNPPWLAMSQLAENPYTEALSARASVYGIAPGGAAHLHLELATTFLIHAADRYLRDGAVIGCLLPGTLFNGSHHQRFRDGDFLRAERAIPVEINEVWEIEPGTFKVRSAAIIGTKRNAGEEFPMLPIGIHARHAGLEEVAFEVRLLGERSAWILGGNAAPLGAPTDEPPPPQGADLMPRPSVCVDVLSRNGTEWQVNTPTRASASYYAVKDSKKQKGEEFPGYVAPGFIYRMVQSLNLLPFVCLAPFPNIAIPARRTATGAWQCLNPTDVRTQGLRQSALRFQRIDDSLVAAHVVKPLFEKIDERNKLSAQVFRPGQFLVLTGAGGGIACAAVLAVDGHEDVVIDQTLYWRAVDTESEAWYRVGILNSAAVTEATKPFNPQGEFGARHLHTLPHRVIPRFDPVNEDHLRVSALAEALCRIASRLASEDGRIGNPGRPIAARRSRLRSEIANSAELRELEQLCAAILGTTPMADL